MAKKTHDLCIKVGTYMNQQGEEKVKWENVGVALEGDNGPFLLLKRTFNPAGVLNPDSNESCLISMFTPKDKSPIEPPVTSKVVPDDGWE